MKINTFNQYFSYLRLRRYLALYSNNFKKALVLYRANIRLCQSFYPILSILEISLRNALDQQLKTYFSDTNWLINQQSGYMSDSALNLPRNPFFMKRRVMSALRQLGPSATHDGLFSELTFGFWTMFFEPTHYSALRGQPIKIFTKRPRTIRRNNIYDKLQNIRAFRNRVYHYEPICFSGSNFDLTETKEVYQDIKKVLSWFNSDLYEFLEPIDFVEYELARIAFLSKNLTLKYKFLLILIKFKYIAKKVFFYLKFEKYS